MTIQRFARQRSLERIKKESQATDMTRDANLQLKDYAIDESMNGHELGFLEWIKCVRKSLCVYVCMRAYACARVRKRAPAQHPQVRFQQHALSSPGDRPYRFQPMPIAQLLIEAQAVAAPRLTNPRASVSASILNAELKA